MLGKDFGKIVRYREYSDEEGFPALLLSENPYGDFALIVFGLPGAPATYMDCVDYSSEPCGDSWSYIKEGEKEGQ